MRMRIGLLILLLGFSASIARSHPITGAVLQGWYYDQQDHLISLRVVNTGDKIITAFTLDVTITDSDGSSSHSRWTRDFLNSVAYAESGGQPRGPAPIPVGASYDEKIGVSPNYKDFSATLILAVFADKTASTTDSAALQDLMNIRSANAAAIDKATELINASATLADAQVAIKNYRDTYKATPHEKLEMQTGDLENIANDLKALPDKAAVKDYLTAKKRERDLWFESAKLQEVTQ